MLRKYQVGKNLWFVICALLFAALPFYLVIRSGVSTVLIDVLGLGREQFVDVESGVFVTYILVCLVALVCWRFYMKPHHFRMQIAEDIAKGDLYEPAVNTLYKDWRSYMHQAGSYANYDIAGHTTPTVFAITGHWRAGKTTAAGQFVQKMRRDKEVSLHGEYYHDSFSFGDVSDSIASFFGQLAEMTGIEEFETLGRVTAPALGNSVEIGPITLNNPFNSIFEQESTSELRKAVYSKLGEQSGSYVVVIDDLDRLKVDEQLMWLRVIELLGKFSGDIILLVPINLSIVEKMVEDALVSRQYIDKILPIQLPVGVDLGYIRKRMLRNNLGFKRQELFAKYVMSLALRIAISEHASHSETSSSWRARLRSGDVSVILRQVSQSLGFSSISGGFGETEYYRPEFQVTRTKDDRKQSVALDTNNDVRISMSIGEPYERFFGGSLAYLGFGRDHYGYDTMGDFSAESKSKLQSYSDLYVYFGDVRYKNGTFGRDVRYESILPEDSAREGSYWFDFVYPSLELVESDPAFARYFSYRLINREIDVLLAKKPKEVAPYLAQLVNDNNTAH